MLTFRGVTLAVAVCGLSVVVSPAIASSEVNVYSARKEALIRPLLDRFEKASGIPVNLVTAKAGPLLQRLQAEGDNTPADLLVTTDAGRLHRARAAGVLAAVHDAELEAEVPPAYRDPEGFWFGLSLRARPIMYVRGAVDPATLSTYEALAEPRWKGRICVRSSSNIYNQSLVASLIAADGEHATLRVLQGLVANFARPPRGGDRDQIKAAAAGRCTLAIANTYYLARMLASSRDDERAMAERIAVFWPNQGGRGAHVNVSGAGITRAAKHRTEALALLRFLVSEEAQEWYARVNNEYPVKPGVAISSVVRSFGEFKPDALNLSALGVNNPSAVRLMDRAGWK